MIKRISFPNCQFLMLVIIYLLMNYSVILLSKTNDIDTFHTQSIEENTTAKDSILTSAKPDTIKNSSTIVSQISKFLSCFANWANRNQGLIAIIIAGIAGFWALWRYQKIRRIDLAQKRFIDKTDPKQRYMNHLIEAYRYLPVAGFETNLRIPIPLEKVYVTLYARRTDFELIKNDNKPGQVDEDEVKSEQAFTAEQALDIARKNKFHGVIILGNPGSGKTTLAKHLLLHYASDKLVVTSNFSRQLLPVLLFLRDINPEKSLIENILISFQKHPLGLNREFFEFFLYNGQAILLLDGLDEVSNEDKRKNVSVWIHNHVHLTFPKCPIVITSRYSGYRGEAVLPGYYLRMEIQDYNLNQIRQFLENWLMAVETHLHKDSRYWRNQAKISAEELYKSIESTPALLELAVNPLMLQIIAFIHRDRYILPDRRIELYKECTDVLLERWDKAKGMQVLLSAIQARQLLQPIALWMHSVEHRREVTKEDILDFIAPVLPRIKLEVNGEDLLKSWQERSGIFKGEGNIYFFHHLSFQEYLTAEEIRNNGKVDILIKQFDRPWWHEPTLLAVGLTNPPIFKEFMTALMASPEQIGSSIDFLLRCIDEAMVKTEEPFINVLQKSQFFENRYYAMLCLQRIGTNMAKTAVKEILNDNNQRIADFARTIMVKWDDKAAIEKNEDVTILLKGETQHIAKKIYNLFENNTEYILIQGGTYKFSVNQEQKEIEPLYFSRYPVTNKLYRMFINFLSGNISDENIVKLTPDMFAGSLLNVAERIKGFRDFIGDDILKWTPKLVSRYDNDKRFGGDNHPVVGISWYAAIAYCLWLTELEKAQKNNRESSIVYRLSKEAEWEWAAAGRQEKNGLREYPWGNVEPDKNHANFAENIGNTTPIEAFHAGATLEGLMDMAGNVWEWIDGCFDEEKHPGVCVIRGGAWMSSAKELRCDFRVGYYPDGVLNNYIGFRVVREVI